MKYKLVAFDLEKTLTKKWTSEEIAKKYGFFKKFKELDGLAKTGKIKHYQLTIELAKLLEGRKKSEIHRECKKVHLVRGAKNVIYKLKKWNLKTAIITTQLSPISEFFSEKLKVDYLICPKLLFKDNVFTGKVDFKKYFDKNCPYDKKKHSICKKLALIKIAKKEKISLDKCVAVGDSATDLCMLKVAGLAIGVNPSKEIENLVDVRLNKLTDILKFI